MSGTTTTKRLYENRHNQIYNSKLSDIQITTSRSMFTNRRGLDRTSVLPYRKGKPLATETEYIQGVIPHYHISSRVLNIGTDIYEFMEWIYKSDPLVSSAVDHYTAFVVSSGYKVVIEQNEKYGNRVDNWMRVNQIDDLIENIERCMCMFGDVYLWKDYRKLTNTPGRPKKDDYGIITDMRIIHPKDMFVKQNEYGEVVGYLQRKSVLDKTYAFFNPNEIIHFKYKSIADKAYSSSLAEVMIRDLHYQRYAEHSLAEVFHDYISPLIHAKCGLDNAPGGGQRPASEKSIEKVEALLSSLQPNEDLVTDNSVQLEILSPGRSVGDYQPALEHFRTNALMGTGLPFWFFGLTANITEASAVVMKEILEKHLKVHQNRISSAFEAHILPYVLLEILRLDLVELYIEEVGEEPDSYLIKDLIDEKALKIFPRLVWNPSESFSQRTDRLLRELNAGGLTYNEYRKESGRPPLDDPLADLTLPLLEIKRMELQLQYQQKIRGIEADSKKVTESNSDTVDESGKPKAKSTDTHRRDEV